MIWSFTLIFLLCESGEAVSHQFDEFDNEFWQSNWYLFPIEMQRMLVIVMLNTQRPAIIQGYANTLCSRDAFKTVKFLMCVRIKSHQFMQF